MSCLCLAADGNIEKWGIYELSLFGPTTGNPFIDIQFGAVFKNGDRTFEPKGFYDGNGIFKIRFMPNAEGLWTWQTKSNCDALNDKKGQFTCVAPSSDSHGPVRVRNQYHFGHEDGTPFFPFGTTLYEWPFQSESLRCQTLETLKKWPFNKVRMLLVPPYESYYIEGPDKLIHFPFVGTSKENWDFSRFNPEFFRNVEQCVEQLCQMGIEADLILFRPYDKGKWGFDTMDMATNERFVRYAVARFAAYRNIWWSLANENSYIKQMMDSDWDRLFQAVQESDPYAHPRSIHNADRIYDYTKPWVTHVSLQYYMAVRWPGISPLLRDIYKKPIVHDEINYEGDMDRRWGQLTGQEMTYRFWNAYIGGAYATHGEALEETAEGKVTRWISKGGKLYGQSPERIAFLKRIIESGPQEGLDPVDQYYESNIGGHCGTYYLIYFGKDPVSEWEFCLPQKGLEPEMRFHADLIDTWDMTITPVEQVFEIDKLNRYTYIDKKRAKIEMPGKPYMALRIQRIE
ncbi:MAG: DUF5605 domain-containing protein [Sedimentisphaerales bacterium]|nr:DUF5605 domain-containing protein [Sedimentisphaerales bacterium]